MWIMTRATILSIVGLGAAATLAHGQAGIAFDTYTANHGVGILVTYGPGWMGPPIGTPIDNTFTGVLLYSATPIDDVATTLGNEFTPLNPVWTVGSVGTFATPSAIPNGYIVGPNLNIAASSDGQTVYLELAAFNGASWDVSTWKGHSASFTAVLAGGTTLPNADQLDNLQPFQVVGPISPEPTTLALGGLGMVTLFLFRRKQA
jgi:hypothetical protein